MSTCMVQREIISTATDLYTRYGFKIITMDEISAVCGISKKTIYTHFESKLQLVDQVVVNLLDKIKSACTEVAGKSDNAIDEVMSFGAELEDYYRQVDYRLVEELRRYYHQIWERIIQVRTQDGFGLILNNLVRGQKEELFHVGFDNDLMAEMRLAELRYLHENASRKDFPKMFHQATLHYLMGISTPKGQSELKKYMNN